MTTSTHPVTDADIAAYYDIFSATCFGALVSVAGCRYSSTGLIAATVAEAHRRCDDPRDVANVEASALSVEACPAQLITNTLEAWAAGGAVHLHCALLAANHPRTGPHAEQWWERIGDGAVRGALLANPAAPAEFLEAHWAEHPQGVAANPACPPLLLAELLGDGHARWENSVHHPDIAPGHLETAVSSDDAELRARGYRNPRHDTDTLRAFYAVELHRHPYSVRASNTLAAVLGIHLPADPRDATIAEVLFSPLRTDLAAIVAALDEDSAATAAALVRSGFTGTVGELCDVAAAVTR